MTEHRNQPGEDRPAPDETFTWTNDPNASTGTADEARASGETGPEPASSAGATATATAVAVLEQLRDAIDELAERASPTVREYSARIAELAAFAADRTAPFLKRAGEVTADASGKLAEKSRVWAADLRASQASTHEAEAPAASTTGEPAAEAAAPAEPAPPSSDEPGPA